MDIKQAIQTRRSVKHYDPAHQMTEAEVNELMEHAILSPTAFNIQHWRFVNAWEKQPERYWQHAPKSAQNAILPAIENYYTNHHQGQRDECVRSASIAAMNIMLMARGMGYDSCPMDGFDFDKVARIINLPHDHIIVMMITVGKKLEDARPRAGQLPLEEVFFTDSF